MNRLLALVAALVLASGSLAGCSALGDSAGLARTSLTVLGPWTGPEEQAFQEVLDGFRAEHHVEVHYQGTRALSQVLLADVQKGQPPDVAVLSSPGELARYARSGDLHPITDVAGPAQDEYSDQWRELPKLGTADRYAVPVKADLKSIVWYHAGALPGAPPQTWDELVTLTRNAAGRGVPPWCLGMEASQTSGWPGTDWIEDILLHQAGPQAYQRWAAGRLPWTSPEVRRAWTTWGELLGLPGAVRGGSTGALLTAFGDAGRPMFDTPPGCLLEHQASFAMGGYLRLRPAGAEPRPGQDFDFFPFPGFAGVPRSFEVSVDLAGMFRDSPQARELMAYLAGSRAQGIWPARHQGSAFSVNRQVLAGGAYRDPVSLRVAQALTSAGPLCLDASDVMPAELGNAFSRAVLEYLANPERLDAVLDGLERVRAGMSEQDRLDLPCGS